MNKLDAELIKESLTMGVVLDGYGIETSPRGRIPCPLHNGQDRNFSYKDHYFNCFVCGRKGSVIDFAMQLFNIDVREAMIKLNEDFNLGLETDESISPVDREIARLKAKNNRAQNNKSHEYKTAQKFEKEEWDTLLKDYSRLKEAIRVSEPEMKDNGDIIWNPLWVEAQKQLPIMEYKLDCWLDEHNK